MPTLVVRKRLLVRRDRADGAYTQQLRTALQCMVALSPDGREMVARDTDGEETGHALRRLRGVVEWRPPLRSVCSPSAPPLRAERLVWDPVSGVLALRDAPGGRRAARVRARGWLGPSADPGWEPCASGVGVLAARTLGWDARVGSADGAPPLSPAASPPPPPLVVTNALHAHWPPGAVLLPLTTATFDAGGVLVIVGYDGHGHVRLCPLYAPSCGPSDNGPTRTIGVRDMLEHHALVDTCEGTDRRVGTIMQHRGQRRSRCVVVRVRWDAGIARCTCVPLERAVTAGTVEATIGVDGWVAMTGQESLRRIAAPPVRLPRTLADVHTGVRYRAVGVAHIREYPIYIAHTTKGGVRTIAAHEVTTKYRDEGGEWAVSTATTGRSVDRMLRASGARPLTRQRAAAQPHRTAPSRGALQLARTGTRFRMLGGRGRAYWRRTYTLPPGHPPDPSRIWAASRILPYVVRESSKWARADVRADVGVAVYPRGSVTDHMLTLLHQVKTRMWVDHRVSMGMRTELTRYVDRVMHWTETTGWFARVALAPGTLLLFDHAACAHASEETVDWEVVARALWADRTGGGGGGGGSAEWYVERVFDLLLVTGPAFDAVPVRVFPGEGSMTLSEWSRAARRSHDLKRRRVPALGHPRSLAGLISRRRKDPPPRTRSLVGTRVRTAVVRRVAVVPLRGGGTEGSVRAGAGLWCVERPPDGPAARAPVMTVRADIFRRASVRARDGVVLCADRTGVCQFQRLSTRARAALGVELAADGFRTSDAAPIVLTLWDGVEDARASMVRKWGGLGGVTSRRHLTERIGGGWTAPRASAIGNRRLGRALSQVGADGCGEIDRVVVEELPVTFPLNMDRMLVALARAVGVPLRVDDTARPSRLRAFHTDTSVVCGARRLGEQDMLFVEDGEVTAVDRVVAERRGQQTLRGVGYYHFGREGARRVVGFGWCVRGDDGVWINHAPRSVARRVVTKQEGRALRALWVRWGEVFLYT